MIKKFILNLIYLLLFCPHFIFGQNGFNKIAVGNNSSYLSVDNSSDGNIYYCGFIKENSISDSKALLVKSDTYGNIIWNRIFNIQYQSYGRNVIGTSDGGALVAGMYGDSSGFLDTVFVAKIDSSGNLQWGGSFTNPIVVTYPYRYQWTPEKIIETNDNGYVVVVNARRYHLVDDIYDCRGSCIIKLDSIGNVQWIKQLIGSSSGNMHTYSFIQSYDGNYYLAGLNNAPPNVNWVMKLNTLGDTQWAQSFRPDTQFAIVGLIEELDGNLLLYGRSFFITRPSLMIIDTSGNFLSSSRYTYMGTLVFRPVSIKRNSTGEKFITGIVIDSTGASNPCLVKLDNFNNVVFCKKIFTHGISSCAVDLAIIQDSSIVLVGDTSSLFQINAYHGLFFTNGAGSILKTDGNYTTSCELDPFSLPFNTFTETNYPVNFGTTSIFTGWNNLTLTLATTLNDSNVNCISTGISDLDSDTYLNMFPNPSSSRLNFVLNGSQNISIFNTLGEFILQKMINETGEIDISFLAPGIYFVRSENTVKKFIKE